MSRLTVEILNRHKKPLKPHVIMRASLWYANDPNNEHK